MSRAGWCFPTVVAIGLGVPFGAAWAAWPHDPTVNLPVCTAVADQYAIATAPDGQGGAFVAWQDNRAGNLDVYAQHLLASGAVDPLWPANGLPICALANPQLGATLLADGGGGVFVGWSDKRNGSYYQAYVQHVTAAGGATWTANGVLVSSFPADQFNLHMIADGLGGILAAFEIDLSASDHDVYAQHLTSSGSISGGWPSAGLIVSNPLELQQAEQIAPDGAGGAIIVWEDHRSGTNWDIYGEHITGGGGYVTGEVAICNETHDQRSPLIASDGVGGATVAWQENRLGNPDVFAERVTGALAKAPDWTPNGNVVCDAVSSQTPAALMSDGHDGAIFVWVDYRGGGGNAYALRLTGSGAIASGSWIDNGVALCPATTNQSDLAAISDGAGGAIITWTDLRNGGPSYDIYAQRITSAGSLATGWLSSAIPVSTPAGTQAFPSLTTDGASGAIVAWQDMRNGPTADVYAQRIERFGQLGNPEPALAGIRDVPNDQGGEVRVNWNASYLDTPSDSPLSAYTIWRQAPQRAAELALRGGARWLAPGDAIARSDASRRVYRTTIQAGQTYYWEFVASQNAHGFPAYSYVAPTTGDSVAGSNPQTAFMIEAESYGGAFWGSAPDSGYSVDNLPPVAPAAFSGSYLPPNGTFLSWSPNSEADLAGYRLYRGAPLNFTPSPANRIYDGTMASYHDVTNTAYIYKVCAYDIHGNEGDCSTAQPSGTADVGTSVPRELVLEPVMPNPGRAVADLRFGLPRDGLVRLKIFDPQGRRISTVLDRWQKAGWVEARWDGRDAGGAPAPSGIYFARLEAQGRALMRRFTRIE